MYRIELKGFLHHFRFFPKRFVDIRLTRLPGLCVHMHVCVCVQSYSRFHKDIYIDIIRIYTLIVKGLSKGLRLDEFFTLIISLRFSQNTCHKGKTKRSASSFKCYVMYKNIL